MGKRPRLFAILLFVGTILTAGLVFLGTLKTEKGVPKSVDKAQTLPVNQADIEKVTEVISPDGEYSLTLKEVKKTSGFIGQTVSVSKIKDNDIVKLFEGDSVSVGKVSLPLNAFSPDNKYIFLKIEDTKGVSYIVLKTSGENIIDKNKSIEIVSLFDQKYPALVVTDVTGWGGSRLIVVNTDTKGGSIGPSFWFNVTNLTYKQLSQRFN